MSAEQAQVPQQPQRRQLRRDGITWTSSGSAIATIGVLFGLGDVVTAETANSIAGGVVALNALIAGLLRKYRN